MDFVNSVIDILKYLVTSNFVNFLIMVLLLYYLIKKFDLVSVIDNGINGVKNKIDDAEQAKLKASELLKESNLNLDNLPTQLKMISEDADLRTKTLSEDIELNMSKSVENFRKNSDSILEAEEKKISSELISNTIKSAIINAEENIKAKLNSDIELHYRLIDESIDDLESVQL